MAKPAPPSKKGDHHRRNAARKQRRAARDLPRTFGKHLTSALRLGVWESVWLTNLLALPLLAALAYVRGDLEGFGDQSQ